MEFSDLLKKDNIDPKDVLVLRHRPFEPMLNKMLPWLASEKPNVFNAYQQTQGEKLEKAFLGAKYVASFIGQEAGKALFVGLYKIGAYRPLTREQYWQVPEYIEMKKYGMRGFSEEEKRQSILWFDLIPTEFYASWKGRLIVKWPPPERSWYRRAHKNNFTILTILEESSLILPMPEWSDIVIGWAEINSLPKSWKAALSQWRGIYYIFDASDCKGYVGSACGKENLLGRWQNYAKSGHGGNKLLRSRDLKSFQFSILERLSPDMDQNDVIQRENSWKQRLHTRFPSGLNDN